MGLFGIASIVIALAAVFAYINHRHIGLPTTVGVMVVALGMSLVLIGVGHYVPGLRRVADEVVRQIAFDRAVLQGMLAFLLFAGGLHLDLDALRRQVWVVTLLSVIGTIASTLLVGGMTYYTFRAVGVGLPGMGCLVFGALISPTDPIAVVGVMRRAGLPGEMEAQISGESLFNDGVGVVIFSILLEVWSGMATPSVPRIALLIARESLGGAGIGLALGFVTHRMLRKVNDYKVEVLLTLALAMGSYALAAALGLSGPIAVVIAGLLMGHQASAMAMSNDTREHVDSFWELIDEVLNAVLFLLIGLEVLNLSMTWRFVFAGLLAIIITLLARWMSVAGVVGMIRLRRPLGNGAIAILTWGGLRGGLAVAMALSIPAHDERRLIVAMTYAVVVFSTMVQGLTVSKLVKRVSREQVAAVI